MISCCAVGWTSILFCALICALRSGFVHASHCSDGWTDFGNGTNGRCITVMRCKEDIFGYCRRDEAEKRCRKLNSSLATVLNKDEAKKMSHIVRSMYTRKEVQEIGGDGFFCWTNVSLKRENRYWSRSAVDKSVQTRCLVILSTNLVYDTIECLNAYCMICEQPAARFSVDGIPKTASPTEPPKNTNKMETTKPADSMKSTKSIEPRQGTQSATTEESADSMKSTKSIEPRQGTQSATTEESGSSFITKSSTQPPRAGNKRITTKPASVAKSTKPTQARETTQSKATTINEIGSSTTAKRATKPPTTEIKQALETSETLKHTKSTELHRTAKPISTTESVDSLTTRGSARPSRNDTEMASVKLGSSLMVTKSNKPSEKRTSRTTGKSNKYVASTRRKTASLSSRLMTTSSTKPSTKGTTRAIKKPNVAAYKKCPWPWSNFGDGDNARCVVAKRCRGVGCTRNKAEELCGSLRSSLASVLSYAEIEAMIGLARSLYTKKEIEEGADNIWCWTGLLVNDTGRFWSSGKHYQTEFTKTLERRGCLLIGIDSSQETYDMDNCNLAVSCSICEGHWANVSAGSLVTSSTKQPRIENEKATTRSDGVVKSTKPTQARETTQSTATTINEIGSSTTAKRATKPPTTEIKQALETFETLKHTKSTELHRTAKPVSTTESVDSLTTKGSARPSRNDTEMASVKLGTRQILTKHTEPSKNGTVRTTRKSDDHTVPTVRETGSRLTTTGSSKILRNENTEATKKSAAYKKCPRPWTNFGGGESTRCVAVKRCPEDGCVRAEAEQLCQDVGSSLASVLNESEAEAMSQLGHLLYTDEEIKAQTKCCQAYYCLTGLLINMTGHYSSSGRGPGAEFTKPRCLAIRIDDRSEESRYEMLKCSELVHCAVCEGHWENVLTESYPTKAISTKPPRSGTKKTSLKRVKVMRNIEVPGYHRKARPPEANKSDESVKGSAEHDSTTFATLILLIASSFSTRGMYA